MWTLVNFIFLRYGKQSYAYVAFLYSYENEVYDGDIMMPTNYFFMQPVGTATGSWRARNKQFRVGSSVLHINSYPLKVKD